MTKYQPRTDEWTCTCEREDVPEGWSSAYSHCNECGGAYFNRIEPWVSACFDETFAMMRSEKARDSKKS